MRAAKFTILTLFLAACGDAEPDTAGNEPGPVPIRADGDRGGQKLGPLPEPAEDPIGPPIGAAPAPIKLADDAVMVLGVTSDGWVVHRSSKGIVAIPGDGSASEPVLVSTSLGMVHIRGPVVFVFSNVDWHDNVGELTVWTAAHGAHAIGHAVYGDDAVFANADGSFLGFIANVEKPDELTEPKADVIVTSPDFASQVTVLSKIGAGSDATCRPRLRFVGQRLFSASCAPGSTAAALLAFDPPTFAPNTIATAAGGAWATDGSGESVFYTDEKGGAWLRTGGGQPTKFDHGVGWGTLTPDASAVLYNVGDQLRRAEAPDFVPAPIIINGLAGRAGVTSDLSQMLYSTKITYDGPVRRDLVLTRTSHLNMIPMQLVEQPLAELTRSVFTRDDRWAIYLIASESGEKTLHLRSLLTLEGREIAGVDTAVAAHGSRIVYSDNRSGPETWPITADLKVADPSAEGEPVTLRTGTTDGRAFHLSEDGQTVFYATPADGSTPSALWAQGVP